MAAAVLVSKPFHRRDRVNASSPIPSSSSSRSTQQTPDPPSESSSKTFQRFRSSLEQSLRTATRSKKAPLPPLPHAIDEFAAPTKGKERAKDEPPPPKMNMLRKVTFRRPARDTPSPIPPPPKDTNDRLAGFTGFLTPSMRQASMSSPTLRLPSPFQPPPPQPASTANAPSTSRSRRTTLQVGTPTQLTSKEGTTSRHRSTKSYPIPPSPSSPSLHHPPRDPSTPTRSSTRTDRSRDPDHYPSSPPDTPTPAPRGQLARTPSSATNKPLPKPTPRASSPVTSRSPSAATRARVVTPPQRSTLTSASTSNLPSTLSSRSRLSPSPPPTPTKPARRPSIDTSKRPSIDGSPTARRPSVDGSPARRPSIDTTAAPRRPSRDVPPATIRRDRESSSPSPTPASSSPIRPRAVSPTQRTYAQNRHFNISSGSLVLSNALPVPSSPTSPSPAPKPTPTQIPANTSPSRILNNPEVSPRDLIRAATSLICREVQKPPVHMARTEQGLRDWEEVEARARGLVRAERAWSSKANGTLAAGRTSSVDLSTGGASGGQVGEDRERKVFCETLRDGYVLCQLMNKLRQSSIVRPDAHAREDRGGNANITKFLAACASYGMPNEDLFLRDDLALGCGSSGAWVDRELGKAQDKEKDREKEREAAARVARTVVRLVGWEEEGEDGRRRERERGKWIRGGGQSPEKMKEQGGRSPYGTLSSASSRATASTPNLLPSQIQSSPRKTKRWSPPEEMTPITSSSTEGSGSGHGTANGNARSARPLDNDSAGEDDNVASFNPIPVPTISRPPPPPMRSALKKQPSVKKLEMEDASGGLFAWARKAAVPGLASATASGSASASGVFGGAAFGASAVISIAPSRDSVADSTRASVGDASVIGFAIGDETGGPHQYRQHDNHNRTAYPPPSHHQHNAYVTQRKSSGGSNVRQSVVSETETTLTSAMSSLLDGGRSSSLFGWGNGNANSSGSGNGGWNGNGAWGGIAHSNSTTSNNNNMYGTIRTVTTDLTSEGEAPSLSRAEGSKVVEEMDEMELMVMAMRGGQGQGYGQGKGPGMSLYGHGHRERKMSEAPVLDLSSLAEEAEESVSSKGHGRGEGQAKAQGRPPLHMQGRSRSQEQNVFHQPQQDSKPVHLRKGKWPDDFLNAFQAPASLSPSTPPPSSQQTQAQSIPAKHPHPNHHQDDIDRVSSSSLPPASTPLSISPPRKLAIVGPRRGDGGDSSSSAGGYAPRRPTHRPRHTVDGPGGILLPKESILRRDSPDSVSSSARVVLRRHSTKPASASPSGSGFGGRQGVQRGGMGMEDDSASDAPGPVPFPRSVSAGPGEHGTPSPRSSIGTGADGELQHQQQQPRRVLRGRFQSDVESSASSRRGRPNSYDELGASISGLRPRSRFESMVNLGVASGMTSASDLMKRDSVDGSAVRMRLVVREDGKPPTHFQLGNCIGRGQFGSVYRALNLNTGQMVAVKRIRLEGLKEEEVTTLMREVDLVKSLSHPSIVKYEGMARDDDTLSIVLEYAENGSLGQTLKSFGKLNEKLVASYVVKILEGLHYLHTSDVVHCDLKAANILTTKNGNVKLSDFGVSLNLRAMEREIKDVAGTPNWMAPEVIELKGASTKSDIWSLGCTVIELLTGRPPYAEIPNSMSVMFRIVEDSMPPLPDGCSELLKDFLEQCFNKDPTQRPSAELLCEHPWLKMNWVALKELRPQDSIPFLRRVSTDLHKSDAVRYLSQLDLPDTHSPISGSPKRGDDAGKISPIGRRTSASSMRPLDNEFSPREHTFVKTTFSKPMVCRVCLLNVKKTAVLCSQCSLISHPKCAVNAPPTCDLRAQLLLYAQYAEKSNPTSVYSNPALDALHDVGQGQNVAMSDVPFVEHTPRTSMDLPQPPTAGTPTSLEHPPTAFKFMAAFRRSRSNLSPEPAAASSSSTPPLPPSTPTSKDKERDTDDTPLVKRRVLQKRATERPLSITSTSTGLSSLRSAATAAESFSSRQNTGKRSQASGSAGDADRARIQRPVSDGVALDRTRSTRVPQEAMSETTGDFEDPPSTGYGLPGSMPTDTRRTKKHKSKSASSSTCTLQ